MFCKLKGFVFLFKILIWFALILLISISPLTVLSASYCQKMLIYDALDGRFLTIKLRPRQPSCCVCGDNPTINKLQDYELFCGASATDKVRNSHNHIHYFCLSCFAFYCFQRQQLSIWAIIYYVLHTDQSVLTILINSIEFESYFYSLQDLRWGTFSFFADSIFKTSSQTTKSFCRGK